MALQFLREGRTQSLLISAAVSVGVAVPVPELVPLPRQQSAWRDVALVLGHEVPHAALAEPQITPENVLSHIRYLASDELRGRGSGTPVLCHPRARFRETD